MGVSYSGRHKHGQERREADGRGASAPVVRGPGGPDHGDNRADRAALVTTRPEITVPKQWTRARVLRAYLSHLLLHAPLRLLWFLFSPTYRRIGTSARAEKSIAKVMAEQQITRAQAIARIHRDTPEGLRHVLDQYREPVG